MKIFYTVLLIIFIFFSSSAQFTTKTGLYFSSHETVQDYRTSLKISPDKRLDLEKGMTLSFDISFRPGDGDYGYVVRIIGDEGVHLDLVTHTTSYSTNFWLVNQDSTLFSLGWKDLKDIHYDQWVGVKINIDPLREEVSLTFHDWEQKKKLPQIKGISHPTIVFGAQREPNLVSTDVAPMTLRHIRIADHAGKILRHWELSKHVENLVYDEISGAAAEVLNPVWKIDDHVKWQQVGHLNKKNIVGVCTDDLNNRVFIIGRDTLSIYEINSKQTVSIPYQQGKPYNCRSNTFIYDPLNDHIINYNFDTDAHNVLDIQTGVWSLPGGNCNQLPAYWHHNKAIMDNTLVTFGGYGYYTYKNILLQSSLTDPRWQKMEAKGLIEPRYLSAWGEDTKEGNWYIFGGYGSKSGSQQISPRHYLDLHRFDPKSRTLEKVWNTTIEKRKSKVPASSLVPSENHDGFYALLFDNSQYHTHLQLAKIRKDISEVNFYQDSIPYTFLDTDSWSTLYLNESSQELIALTHHGDEIKLFSQAFPPMLPADIHQDIVSPFHWKERALWLTGILALFIILALVFKRKSKIPLPLHEGLPVSEVKAVVPPRSGGFYFLGGFLVFDSTGKDITSEFTPTLKLLFLLIYFYSARSGKGINSTQLTEYVWPEKTDNSARNNRNVNIRKLRLLLEKTGNVEVKNDNTYWKIVLPDNVFSDYEHLYGLADQVKSFKDNLNDQGLAEFLHYAGQGELCPSVQTEWIDKYKVDLSNRIIDELSVLLEAIPWEKANYPLMAQIASSILKHDVLNEEALQIKCTALYLMGKKGIAKHCYDKFCTEYKNSMGSDFPMKFKSLLKVYS